MSTLSTHVLDSSIGRPAAGLEIVLEANSGPSDWREIARGVTNHDGRIKDFLPFGTRLEPGVYRLIFDTGGYFSARQVKGFYPDVTITFEISDDEHYHVPLLLSPFGFSTYRGS